MLKWGKKIVTHLVFVIYQDVCCDAVTTVTSATGKQHGFKNLTIKNDVC